MIDQGEFTATPAGAIDADSIAGRRFLTGVRGYVREEVHAYLRAVADAVRERDEKIARLEAELAQAKTGAPQVANVVVPEIRDLFDSAERLATGIKIHAHGQLLNAYRQGSSLLSVIEDARARFELAESAITDALRTVMESTRRLTPESGANAAPGEGHTIVLPAGSETQAASSQLPTISGDQEATPPLAANG